MVEELQIGRKMIKIISKMDLHQLSSKLLTTFIKLTNHTRELTPDVKNQATYGGS